MMSMLARPSALDESADIRRIVVGVVDSKAGRRALRVAFDAARRNHAELVVITSFGSSARGRNATRTTFTEALREQGSVMSQELGVDRWNVAIYSDAVRGEPVEVLVACAIGADLLIVGTSRRWLRTDDTVASRCRRAATCGVVLA